MYIHLFNSMGDTTESIQSSLTGPDLRCLSEHDDESVDMEAVLGLWACLWHHMATFACWVRSRDVTYCDRAQACDRISLSCTPTTSDTNG